MTTFLDKLNLRPQERRLVVGGAAVLFVVLQFWLVWPRFKDWAQVKGGLDQAKRTLAQYRSEIARTNEYRLKLDQLEREGISALTEDKAQPGVLQREMQREIVEKASRSQLSLGPISPRSQSRAARTARTDFSNLFFE